MKDISSPARMWLIQYGQELDLAQDLPQGLKTLTGLHLCDVLAGTGIHPNFMDLAARIAKILENSSPNFDPERTNISQLLTSCWLLKKHQFSTGSLGEIAIELADSLAQFPPPIPAEYSIVQLLLSRLGLDTPEINSARLQIDLSVPGRLGLLLASPQLLSEICNYICIDTLGGTIQFTPTEDERLLSELLLPIALERLRRYELELGCMLIRALLYLDRSLPTQLDPALQWLAAQQTNAGNFGYFASQCQQLSFPQELMLDTTISCLWTLAEWRVANFRLFGSIAGMKSTRI
jgi:hypothetical protein